MNRANDNDWKKKAFILVVFLILQIIFYYFLGINYA